MSHMMKCLRKFLTIHKKFEVLNFIEHLVKCSLCFALVFEDNNVIILQKTIQEGGKSQSIVNSSQVQIRPRDQMGLLTSG